MGLSRHLALSAFAVLLALAPSLARAQPTSSERRNIETGFIWTQSEAEEKCPRVAAEAHGRWTGQWRMSVPGQTSFCEVTDFAPPRVQRPTPHTTPPRAQRTRAIEAGPIWNQSDAEVKCRRVAAEARGEWTGQWRTVTPGRMSVCDIADVAPRSTPWPRYVEAGPIRDQQDAETKCPVVAAAVRGQWSGQWMTTMEGQMSACAITDMAPPQPRTVEAGPIWDQSDANVKCPVAATAVRARWTGQWMTTRQGEMSVCEVVD
ncbi:MAG: mannan-binding lectin [Hyphomonadaceae bacterium]|nr:MAG: hypothetical protein FD160_853 [Caulobacteraceae bacterium]MBT9444898.1 mannan-binding lectin [Hyphomonadaceae bacterium]TPW04491.1 MAG: hypothetical protein FD124_2595 [Alphaproteobacteria bacterium]